MSRTTRAVAVAGAASAALVVAGCGTLGGSGAGAATPTYVAPSTTTRAPEPAASGEVQGTAPGRVALGGDIMRMAKAPLINDYETVTIKGTLPADKRAKTSKVSFTVTGQVGKGGGSVATIRTESGAKAQVQVSGASYAYIKADKAFLEETRPVGSELRKHAGEWVQVDLQSSPFDQFRPAQIARTYFTSGKMEPVDLKNSWSWRAEHDGTEMYAVQIPSRSGGSRVDRLVWVSTDPDKPRIVDYTDSKYPNRTELSFSGWGQKFTPPPDMSGVPKIDAAGSL